MEESGSSTWEKEHDATEKEGTAISSRETIQLTRFVCSTVTVTVTEEPVAKLKRDVQLEARQATEIPTEVPAYASSCDEVRYASACDCWGITAEVTTAPTPTVTVTTTIDYCEVCILLLLRKCSKQILTCCVGPVNGSSVMDR